MDKLTLHYLLFVFVTAMGVLQTVAAYNKGLSWAFFRSSALGYLFGAAATVAALWWFFSADNRNTPGLAGWEQFRAFSVAAFSAYLTTGVVSSKIRTLKRLAEANPGKTRPRRNGRASKSLEVGWPGK